MLDLILSSIPLAIVAAIPLALAVLGEVVVQRSGIINLGLEGMMLSAALAASVGMQLTGSTLAGFAAAVAGAGLTAVIFGALVIHARSDQIVAGTAINLLALGVTGFLNNQMQRSGHFAASLSGSKTAESILIALAWFVFPLLVSLLLWFTSFGLRLRACGENPEAVEAAIFSVRAHRWGALAIEAFLAGIAGADLSLLLSSGFAENMTAGRGYIALAIVIFGRWRVLGAIAGTTLFGAAATLQYALQAANRGVPFHLLLAVPYVVTLLILVFVTERVRPPAALGRN